MEINKLNYTPIDINKLNQNKKNDNLNYFLLVVLTITAAIFSVVLFIYIQKKLQTSTTDSSQNQVQETITPEPTGEILKEPTPTLTASTESKLKSKESTSSANIATPPASLNKSLETTSSSKIATDTEKIK